MNLKKNYKNGSKVAIYSEKSIFSLNLQKIYYSAFESDS